MGNTITNRRKSRNASAAFAPTLFTKQTLERERKGNKQRYELRSKTLPARNRKRNAAGAEKSSANNNTAQTLPNHKLHYNAGANPAATTSTQSPPPPNGENSRVLFLLYLIHRTWNVITDTKSKSSSHGKVSRKPSNHDSFYETESNCSLSLSLSDLYEVGGGGVGGGAEDAPDSQCCSQYSLCSCSSCYADKNGDGVADITEQNVYNSIDEQFSQDSIVEKRASLFKSSKNYNKWDFYQNAI